MLAVSRFSSIYFTLISFLINLIFVLFTSSNNKRYELNHLWNQGRILINPCWNAMGGDLEHYLLTSIYIHMWHTCTMNTRYKVTAKATSEMYVYKQILQNEHFSIKPWSVIYIPTCPFYIINHINVDLSSMQNICFEVLLIWMTNIYWHASLYTRRFRLHVGPI